MAKIFFLKVTQRILVLEMFENLIFYVKVWLLYILCFPWIYWLVSHRTGIFSNNSFKIILRNAFFVICLQMS